MIKKMGSSLYWVGKSDKYSFIILPLWKESHRLLTALKEST